MVAGLSHCFPGTLPAHSCYIFVVLNGNFATFPVWFGLWHLLELGCSGAGEGQTMPWQDPEIGPVLRA